MMDVEEPREVQRSAGLRAIALALTQEKIADRLAWCWLALVAGAIAVFFGDYGLTWDEGKHIVYGNHILAYFASFGQNREAMTYSLDYLYGGGYDFLGALFRRCTAAFLHEREAMHLLGAMVGWLSMVGAWRLGRALFSPWAGLLGLVLLSLTPVYIGQLCNNPKDVPFAAGYIWALVAIHRLLRELPQVRTSTLAWAALALGLATCVRIAGLILSMFLLTAVAGESFIRARQHVTWEARYQVLRAIWPRVAMAIAGGWLVMILPWPWAHMDPIARPLVALMRMSSFASHRRMMPFAGEMVSTLDVPRSYLVHYFGLMLPELILVGLGAGIVYLLLRKARHGERIAAAVMVAALLVPPSYAVIKHSPLYDGLRHFLFLIPLICVLAAGGIHAVLSAVSRWHARPARVAYALGVAILIAGLADAAHTIIVLHPHQYVWFNRLSGGLARAVTRYDTDYYGNSYRSLLETLPQQLWRREPSTYLNHVYSVRGCLGKPWVTYYLPANFVGDPGKGIPADFHAGYTRDRCLRGRDRHPVVHETIVEGATISAVLDMRTTTPSK